MILAGDTGGTKTRLALYEEQPGKLVRRQTETFASADFPSLEEIIRTFLSKNHTSVKKACFGVPGPIVAGRAQSTNLPWLTDEAHITRTLGIASVKLVNDLVATTSSIPFLNADDLLTVHQGLPAGRETTFGVLAPGTGLGQAFLYKQGGQFIALPSEGGHADFAPNNEIEIALLKYLLAKFRRVSYERVLCGPGLVNIYNFLKDTGVAAEPPELSERFVDDDPAAVISTSGQSGEFAICVQALDIFASILGAQAGNLVLTMLATGGIYLGGGIPPKISQKLMDGTAVAAYANKGRLSDFVKATPLYVIRDDHAALLGSAYLASML
ncbi:MAG: glucokinase [bacterium]